MRCAQPPALATALPTRPSDEPRPCGMRSESRVETEQQRSHQCEPVRARPIRDLRIIRIPRRSRYPCRLCRFSFRHRAAHCSDVSSLAPPFGRRAQGARCSGVIGRVGNAVVAQRRNADSGVDLGWSRYIMGVLSASPRRDRRRTTPRVTETSPWFLSSTTIPGLCCPSP